MTWRPALHPVCGRCGKRREGIRHVCRSNSRRKATVKLRLSFGKCPSCKKPVTNPLTHTCRPESDFGKRKAQAPKGGKKQRSDRHDYQACGDKDCPRPLCVAYKTGFRSGYQQGYELGYAIGWRAGFDAGFAAGIAACPRSHAA